MRVTNQLRFEYVWDAYSIKGFGVAYNKNWWE